MATTKVIALVSSVSGGSSLVAGSVFLDNGAAIVAEQATYRTAPSGRHFGGFDLSCIQWYTWFRKGGVFFYLNNPEKIRGEVSSDFKSPDYKLEGPASPTSGSTVDGCLMTTFLQTPDSKKVGVTMLMAASKGKHGIILMNTISNTKDKKGASLLRALFLEKKDYYWWEFKGGIQWSDEEYLKNAKKLKWTGLVGRTEDIDLETTVTQPLRHNSFTLSWKNDTTKGKNIYQQLAITADPTESSSKKPTNFWNENAEPVSTTIIPSAVFAKGVWAQVTGTPDLAKAKDWFNIFKDVKGSWENS